ncbi:hypothetical protein Sinac_7242 [Singulisphaera acidiphila DSM 18658]|uniref:Uncharacterized protein n=1 Tax=Singulisphaera acidiphila (strain ATCC BAA-1392 / DSM 18658 / VKM B-2454 / MOB10) TaxID=886293 RepID=L0DPJ2_SINAD|nr:hypothetical protein Sinac_7242 [Singulisphaera acidiphila DSM 18658]
MVITRQTPRLDPTPMIFVYPLTRPLDRRSVSRLALLCSSARFSPAVAGKRADCIAVPLAMKAVKPLVADSKSPGKCN